MASYLARGVKRALDQGVQAVYLEEPEFWARSGLEREFQAGMEGLLPRRLAAARLLARRAISRVEAEVLSLSPRPRAGLRLRQRPTAKSTAARSPATWPRTRSSTTPRGASSVPESSLIGVGAAGLHRAGVDGDGAHAQHVRWRAAKSAHSRRRSWSTASMQNLVRASGRRIWYLNDPVADSPNSTWDDYRIQLAKHADGFAACSLKSGGTRSCHGRSASSTECTRRQKRMLRNSGKDRA